MHVFCDFDGTISTTDTADAILHQFAAPEWHMIEDEWKRGDIGSAECMRRQIALIRASTDELDAALDAITIDPTFPDFVRYCASINAPITIISDGVDYFIRRILSRYALGHLPIIANQLMVTGEATYALSCPYTNPDCRAASGVCKCGQIDMNPAFRIFVGDGRSDFCATESADLLFAKTSLATYCEQRSIDYVPYLSFADVQCSLEQVRVRRISNKTAVSQPAFA